MLTVKPAENNGGLKIERYWIRQKQEGQDWPEEDELPSVKAFSNAITVRVTKLTPEESYYFGACAENAMGKGDFLDSDFVTVLPKRLGMYEPAHV